LIMKKNDILEVVASDYSLAGWAVAKPDNFPLFIKGLLVGEKAEIVVTRLEKHYGYGKVRCLLSRSPHRVEARCPVAGQCGGCQFQHIAYDNQLKIKDQLVQQVIERKGQGSYKYAGINGMEHPLPYRNKVQIPFAFADNGNLASGFYRVNSHDIINMDYCNLQSELTNAVYQRVRDLVVTYNLAAVLRHLVIRESSIKKELMLILVVKDGQIGDTRSFVKEITKEFPMITSIFLNYNTSNGNVILGEKLRLLYGQSYLTDELLGYKFQISPKAFYQINSRQCEQLYRKASQLAEITVQDCVLDLFCGVGTIGIILAKQAKKVIGIEIVEEAVIAAQANAKVNGCNNIEFYCGDAAMLSKQLPEEISVVFVDPPRQGLSEQTRSNIKKLKAQRLLYISCNPLTFIRDLEDLKEVYDVGTIWGFDMFPYTSHIELVCRLDIKSK